MKKHLFVPVSLICALILHAAPAVAASSCMTGACHPKLSALANLHAPVKEGDCSSCHTQRQKEHPLKEGKSFQLAAKGKALCESCHEGMAKKKFVHEPVKEGDCVSCHDPHGGNGRYLLAEDDQNSTCLKCHEKATFHQKFMHGPAAVGSCTECHDPHQSDSKALLKGSVRDLCLKCHADFAAALKSATVVHPPVAKDPCTACHDSHGAAVPYVLKNKMPDLCTDCHKGIGKRALEAKVPHKPILSALGCSSCHSSHFAKAKGLLPGDELTTCLGCHGTDKLGTPPLKNIKKEITGKKFLHGPIQKGECKGCHDPHGSDNFRMLRGGYPKDLYVPYKDGTYDFCLKCHEKNLLKYRDTTVYTRFRNGNENLHFIHVSNQRKGRTCRICHDPHASDGPKLISKGGGYQFGEWKIPLNFKMTSTGGSCAPGCHRAYKYDREKPDSYK